MKEAILWLLKKKPFSFYDIYLFTYLRNASVFYRGGGMIYVDLYNYFIPHSLRLNPFRI